MKRFELEKKYEESVLHNFDRNLLHTIKFSKWNKFKWKGLTLMKDPMTLTIYQQLINDILPSTIIEFGSYDGGSALWMYDVCKSLNLRTKVITIDINKENFKCDNKEIIFFNLDVNNIVDFFNLNNSFFKNLQKPIIAIEDCHVNVKQVCTQVDKFLTTGDYLVVEDTIDYNKHQTMLDFLDENPNYIVDRKYCDFWGTNNSWNINSFLIKNEKVRS